MMMQCEQNGNFLSRRVVGAGAMVLISALVLAGVFGCAGAPSAADQQTSADEESMVVDEATRDATAQVPNWSGHWEGALEVSGQSLGIVLDLGCLDGQPAATISIPVQGVTGLRLTAVAVTPEGVDFTLPGQVPARFSAAVDGEVMAGDFAQGAASGRFRVERQSTQPQSALFAAAADNAAADAASSVYVNEARQLATADGPLHGTLTIPRSATAGSARVPLVVIISGSGPTDRDGNSPLLPGRNDSLRMVAGGLAARSIASLRFDKRAIGASAGVGPTEADLRIDHYINDVVGWVRQMHADGRFGPIVVAGHSEGALIGMYAAERAADPGSAAEGNSDGDGVGNPVGGFVSIAGLGRRFSVVLVEQLTAQLAVAAPELLAAATAAIETLQAGELVTAVPAGLESLLRSSVQPYLISAFALDPAAQIARLPMPVMVVAGGRDLQVSPADFAALTAARPDAHSLMLDSMNHVLKDVGADIESNQRAYSDPDLPLADGLADALAQFVQSID